MERHVWAVCLGVAAVLAGAAALATGTGESEPPAEEPDDAVVLGEEDLADRAEILRNMYRRITPPDMALVQDVGTWPAAWEEFGANWDSAAADREYGAWVVPVEVTQDAGTTVVKDGNGALLWRGWTDFARPESADVVLTGGLVAEDDWPVYEGIRNAVAAMPTETSHVDRPERTRTTPTNGLRFTSHEWTTNGTFRLELAYEIDTNVDMFAYAVACTSSLVVATWTNDENQVIMDTNTVWTSVGLPFNGMGSDWEHRGTVAISNGVAEFEDSGFTEELSRLRFYAAAVAEDTDGDGLNDGWEDFVSHTDPGNQDSDGDGVPDGLDTMPATSNVWFEVVHTKTKYYLCELGLVGNNAPEVPFTNWSWVVSDQPPTSDSVLQDVCVSGYADDYITVDTHPIHRSSGPYTYNNCPIMDEINDLDSFQFTMELVDWPDSFYSGSNVVCVGRSDSEPFEVKWKWLVPMSVTGPGCVCVGDAAQFEAAGADSGPYTWSVSYEGTTPVGEIDEDGVFTALAPGLATVTATASEVYSVSQAVNVVQIDFLTGGGTVATELKVGKWINAFGSTILPTNNVVFTNGVFTTNIIFITNYYVKENFIDLDPDRFKVRVIDVSKVGEDNVFISLSTTSAEGEVDNSNGIMLYQNPAASGIFVSTNLLLVADDIDDDFSNGYVSLDDTANDQTHKIALDGKVLVQYEPEEDTWMATEISVGKKRTVHVIPVILRDKPEANNGYPVMSVDEVLKRLGRTQKRFAQVGIDVTWETPVVYDPPSGVDLSDGLTVRTNENDHLLAPEARTLVDVYGTTNTIEDIHIFYVTSLDSGTDNPPGGMAVTSNWFSGPAEAPYLYNVFIKTSPWPEWTGCALAHELGHLLGNPHHAPEKWRVMHGGIDLAGVCGSRRFVTGEESNMYGDSHAQQQQ